MSTIKRKIWSKTQDGTPIYKYILTNESGASVVLSNLGAAIVSVNVPDRDGKLADVVLGYGKAENYFGDGPCMGKCPGRFANRIAKGRFSLDGKDYELPVNCGPNHLHGGPDGFMGDKMWTIGLVTAIVLGVIVIGGIKQIAKVAEKVIPFMCVMYIAAGLLVILINIQHLPHAISVVLHQAFHPDAMYGGFIGVIIAGLRRSVQTNEAGTGSAPIAYATAQTKEPISLGFVALTEPLFTGFICLLTATLIVITNAYVGVEGVKGIQLTSNAFETMSPLFGPFGGLIPWILAIIVVLFAVTTILSWAYYSQKAWNFLVGEGKCRTISFQIAFCVFTVIGSVLNAQSVINLTDAMMMAMAVPNLITMYILAPEIKKDFKEYCQKHNLGGWINRDWLRSAKVAEEEA